MTDNINAVRVLGTSVWLSLPHTSISAIVLCAAGASQLLKEYTKINTKTRIQFDCIKILKSMHFLVHNQNFEKIKRGIPKSPNQSFSSAVNERC
jgi:hypothetical protein